MTYGPVRVDLQADLELMAQSAQALAGDGSVFGIHLAALLQEIAARATGVMDSHPKFTPSYNTVVDNVAGFDAAVLLCRVLRDEVQKIIDAKEALD